MEKIAKKLTDLIGNTPLLELENFQNNNEVKAHIIAKLEYFNPAGSVKDRVALSMIRDAEQRGVLAQGGTLIEPTSGNTGVGLALVAAANGYKLILTMPETMSIERRRLLAALGAEIVLTPGAEGMTGAINRAYALQSEIEGSVILNQFGNEANPEVHYRTTAEEIWRDTDGKIDILVGGVGTGGTISGNGKRLKELNPSIEVVAVEPAASPVLSGGKAGAHKLQGIGAGFVPKIYNSEVVDRVITITNEEAFEASRNVATQEGLLVGISSGAALSAALKIAREPQNEGKRIVVILPDSGERYLSTELYGVN
ncbi:MAG: cysteine synthase A [Rikenellaceae bacterium]